MSAYYTPLHRGKRKRERYCAEGGRPTFRAKKRWVVGSFFARPKCSVFPPPFCGGRLGGGSGNEGFKKVGKLHKTHAQNEVSFSDTSSLWPPVPVLQSGAIPDLNLAHTSPLSQPFLCSKAFSCPNPNQPLFLLRSFR